MKEYFIRPGDDIQKAFDSVPEGATIRLAAGIYRQKCVIRVPGLTVSGEDAEKTVIVWNDYAKKKDESGREYNTFRTWTMAVCADGVTIQNLSVINDALCPELKGQEVALSVHGDDFFMRNCVLRSTQDTLFLAPLPPDLIDRYAGFLPDELRENRPLSQRFEDCRIEGTVDFIFGCGTATLERCEIRSLRDARNIGFVAAPAHSLSQEKGFLFRNCRFTAEDGVTGIYLARPWRDYGMARFENCVYDAHIAPEGFDKWNDTNRNLTARFEEYPPVPGRVSWCNRNA